MFAVIVSFVAMHIKSEIHWHIYERRLLKETLPNQTKSLSSASHILINRFSRLTIHCRYKAIHLNHPLKQNSPCGIFTLRKPMISTKWIIQSHAKFDINVTFTIFDISTNFAGCSLAAVMIEWIEQVDSVKTYTFCGKRKPWNIYVPGNTAMIKYLASDRNVSSEFVAQYQIYEKDSIRGTLFNYRNMESTHLQYPNKFILSISDLSMERRFTALHASILIRELPSFRIKLQMDAPPSSNKIVTCYDGPTFLHRELAINSRASNQSSTKFHASSVFVVICHVIHNGAWNLVSEKIFISYQLVEATMAAVNLIESGHVLLNISNCIKRNMRMCVLVLG